MGTYRIAMGYFETMRLPLRRGRKIESADDSRSPGVVVVNEEAARKYWPGQDPVGQRITFDTEKKDGLEWLTVIGVAANAAQDNLAAKPGPEVYLAALQNKGFLSGNSRSAYLTLVVRTAGNPSDFAAVLKQTIWSFDKNLPVSKVITMERALAEATAEQRFEMLLLGVFAAVALILAAVGIYGVMSYSVSRRTHEIGIRISLGASRQQVLSMVLRQGLIQVLVGTIVGATGALLISRLMAKMLYGVEPTDAVTYGCVTFLLVATAMLAILVPARKATRIDPIVALRHD